MLPTSKRDDVNQACRREFALSRLIRAQDTPTIRVGDVNQSAREMPDRVIRSQGMTVEISEGGVSAYLRGEFEAGQQVGLELDLPTGPLELSAIVKNCLGHRYGFQFLELLPEQCQKIQASCKGVPPYRSSLPAE